MASSSLSLSQVEEIAQTMYGPSTGTASRVDPRVSELENWSAMTTLRSVLSQSASRYAIFLACQCLKKLLLTMSSGTMSCRDLVELKDFLASAVVTRHQQGLELFCLRSLAHCLCLVVKRGMLEDSSFLTFVEDVTTAFGMRSTETAGDRGGSVCSATAHGYRSSCASVAPNSLGLLILDTLVNTVGTLNEKKPIAEHRKTSTLFKDSCIDSIFYCAVGCLRKAVEQQGNMEPSDLELTVSLAKSVLVFDYVGIVGTDEGADEPKTMNFPHSWRPLLLQPDFLPMWWRLFECTSSPVHVDVLHCIACLHCTKRSLFQSDDERRHWLDQVLGSTLDVMERGVWLNEPQVCTEFCRLLSRIKPNFQLNELLDSTHFPRWMSAVTEFSCSVMNSWKSAHNAVGYLCIMWQQFVGSQQYAKKEKPTYFEVAVPQVTLAYLQSRMVIAETFAAGTAQHLSTGHTDNPLDDAGDDLKQQLETVAAMLRFSLKSLLQPLAAVFRDAAGVFSSSSQGLCVEDPVAEEKLAWLLLLFGSMVRTPAGEDDNDAEAHIISSCFDVVEVTVKRNAAALATNATALPQASLRRLELAVLHFLHCFRVVYVGEPTNQLANKTLQRLQERLGMASVPFAEMQLKLLDFFVNKIVSNLQSWSSDVSVLDESLRLFRELSSGFSSGRQMLEMGCVRYLLSPGGATTFPFQRCASHYKLRVKYRNTTTSILFLDSVTPKQFREYLAPITSALQQVRLVPRDQLSAAILEVVEIRDALVGALCDLRGVATACIGRRAYHLLFDVLFPNHFETLLIVAEEGLRICSTTATVDVAALRDKIETQLLRLCCELCFNRCQRIQFEPPSVGGFHLFFFLSRVVRSVAERKVHRIAQDLSVPAGHDGGLPWCASREGRSEKDPSVAGSHHQRAPTDSHEWRIKGAQLTFQLAQYGLSGAHCNFGVLQLYQDDRLEAMLAVVWKLLVVFCLDDLLCSPKLAKEYFSVVEQLFASHAEFVSRCSPPEVMRLLHVLEGSMQAVPLHASATTASCNALAHFVKYLVEGSLLLSGPEVGFEGRALDEAVLHAVQRFSGMLESLDSGYCERLLALVFSNVVFNEQATQWSLSQPLLPLMCIDASAFQRLKERYLNSCRQRYGDEKMTTLREAFEKLTDGVDLSLDRRSREKFQQNLTSFRNACKQYL